MFTIGFGETKNVKLGQTITPERALVRLLESADKEHGEKIKRCMKPEVRMYQKEYDWHLSFAYNIGVHGYCTSNTLRLLNELLGECHQSPARLHQTLRQWASTNPT